MKTGRRAKELGKAGSKSEAAESGVKTNQRKARPGGSGCLPVVDGSGSCLAGSDAKRELMKARGGQQ